MTRQKYGNLVPRRPRARTPEEIQLDMRMRGLFFRLVDGEGRVVSRGVQETIEGRQACWRKWGKRVIEAKTAGAKREAVKALVAEFDQWVDDVFDAA